MNSTNDQLSTKPAIVGNNMLSEAVFRPMLFSTPMVRALLDGRKTQTRRICTVQPIDGRDWKHSILVSTTDKDEKKNEGKIHFVLRKNEFTIEETDDRYFKPVAYVGEIIWVRESFLKHPIPIEGYKYKADYTDIQLKSISKTPLKWKSSRFMPKSVCRLFLQVTNIRLEKLWDISETDAISEGIEIIERPKSTPMYKDYNLKGTMIGKSGPVQSYQSLWSIINGQNSWNENPYVWVYGFKLIDRPHGFR